MQDMSVSTDGILFFGFSLEDEGSAPWLGEESDDDDDREWDDIYAQEAGVFAPDKPYDGNEEDYQRYWREKRRVLAEAGCEIDYHCSDGCAIPYIHFNTTYSGYWYRAARGEVVNIPASLPSPTEEMIDKLKAFCEVLSIPWEEPGWHLVSWYG